MAERTENADITVNIKDEQCSNYRIIEEMQTRFGKLFRVGTLKDNVWTTNNSSKTCYFVYAHPWPEKEESAISSQRTPLCCNTTLIVVDKFENRSHIITVIGYESSIDSDPKELIYDIKSV